MSNQVGGGSVVTFEMVPAPPRGERDRGRNETVETESAFLGTENDKGKGVINA